MAFTGGDAAAAVTSALSTAPSGRGAGVRPSAETAPAWSGARGPPQRPLADWPGAPTSGPSRGVRTPRESGRTSAAGAVAAAPPARRRSRSQVRFDPYGAAPALSEEEGGGAAGAGGVEGEAVDVGAMSEVSANSQEVAPDGALFFRVPRPRDPCL